MRRKDRRNRKKIRGHDDVELNVAAMLDMAFQLLAFFILTFKPSPIESQIMMRLPADKPVTQAPSTQVDSAQVEDEGLVISISIYSTPEGEIDKLEVGQRVISAPTVDELLPAFKTELALIVGLGCDSITVRVGEDLRYERLMQIVDICGKQELPSGERLSKVSIVPLKSN
jgi:biopolymer transport protein ExbD